MHADGVVPFITARFHLPEFLERAPMFRPIADSLPEGGAAELRARCERLLTKLFLRALYLPRLSEQEARRILTHAVDPDEFMAQEFSFMRKHEEWRPVLDDWSRIWNDARDESERLFIQYATALLGRLYRLEYAVRLGDDIGRLLAC